MRLQRLGKRFEINVPSSQRGDADERPRAGRSVVERRKSGRTNVDQMLLGTTERDDGKTQATYNGHPLYYYVNEGPNEVRCSNVNSFGGLWFAVAPSGDQV